MIKKYKNKINHTAPSKASSRNCFSEARVAYKLASKIIYIYIYIEVVSSVKINV